MQLWESSMCTFFQGGGWQEVLSRAHLINAHEQKSCAGVSANTDARQCVESNAARCAIYSDARLLNKHDGTFVQRRHCHLAEIVLNKLCGTA